VEQLWSGGLLVKDEEREEAGGWGGFLASSFSFPLLSTD
jgi:hypothetical protein